MQTIYMDIYQMESISISDVSLSMFFDVGLHNSEQKYAYYIAVYVCVIKCYHW